MEFLLSGLGGRAAVAALVVATNLAPTAGLDGLADYTGAAACALATGSDMQDSACRAAALSRWSTAPAATDSVAATGTIGLTRHAAAPTGVVADRRRRTARTRRRPTAGHRPRRRRGGSRTPRRTRRSPQRRSTRRGTRTAVGPSASRHRRRRRPLLRSVRRWCTNRTTTSRTAQAQRGHPGPALRDTKAPARVPRT
jgi:hypothetical protein